MKQIKLNLFENGKCQQKVTVMCRIILVFAFIGVMVNTTKAQIYDPYDVQVINNLIKNNGLNATFDNPESWTMFYNPETGESRGFVEWTEETPKKITSLSLSKKGLTGIVSLAELETLESIGFDESNTTELDLANCKQMKFISCTHNPYFKKLVVTNCTRLENIYLYFNSLTELDLTGINNIGNFGGSHQNVPLTLYKNEIGEYSCAISLNNPTFENSDISYSGGILKSRDNTVDSTFFKVETNLEYRWLSGYMIFTYSDGAGITPIDNPLLKIHPNPVNDTLFIEYKDSLQITVKLYDMYGRKLIAHNAIGNTSINISHLENGSYIVNVFSEGIIIGNAKIVKQ
ncbi:MAG: T9SS type A sorting domain-containing protein [Bacteroidales bacterium]|jgi:hypothetical protein|nr:T9SS type A sorting domain-containing protein [Bacteroidales bacterium]